MKKAATATRGPAGDQGDRLSQSHKPKISYHKAMESWFTLPGVGPVQVKASTKEQFTAWVVINTPTMDTKQCAHLLSSLDIDLELGKWDILNTLQSSKDCSITLYSTVDLLQKGTSL